ncbi:MAG: hypothetical protein M3247_03825 [Thermoproteota archaeon]|nr:hypothetical protein [Thermoproteota archaeon]
MKPLISGHAIREQVLIAILLGSISIDTVLSNLTDLIIPTIPTHIRLILYSVIGVLALIAGTSICINETRRAHEMGLGGPLLVWTSEVMRIVQFILTGLVAAILFEELTYQQYHTLLMVVAMILSYYVAGILLAIISYKFIQWFQAKAGNRRNPVFFFFLVSCAMLSLIVTMSIPAQSMLLYQSFPDVIESRSLPQFPTIEGMSSELIQVLLVIPYLMAPPWVFFTWIGSAFMLKSYVGSIGKLVFWTLILGSLLTIIVGSVIAYAPNTNGPFDKSLLAFRLIGISSIIIQGFLVAFAFLKVSRSVREKVPMQIIESLRTSAIGISLLFASVSANLAFGSFPPLGILSYSFVALGAYLFVTGIYSSAVSVSTDLELRKMIRRFLLDRSGFIDSIGSANVDLELRKLVISMSKKYVESVEENTNLDIPISDSEYRYYLDESIREVLKARKESRKDENDNDSSVGSN